METKRLFIGGLYSGITEKDLRDRFKTFGTVSTVEIIRRTDEQGCPLKTFAYIDMLQTETDFRRCVSLLTNSKWKGCNLKIQAAKESFLTRLERERQVKDPLQDAQNVGEDNSKQETKKQSAIPETLPKAVPGTPLPGKKNWVVGKFGRVLPVVYLRRKDRRKIAKFDPSKTTHCLKKIKPEEAIVSVSKLTWNLDSENITVNGNSKNVFKINEKKQKKLKLKEMDDLKIDLNVNNGVEQHDKKTSDNVLSTNHGTVPNGTNSRKLPASIDDDLKSDSDDSHSESDTQHCHSIKNKIKKNTLNITEDNGLDTSDSITSTTPPSTDISPIAFSNNNSASVELDTATEAKGKLLPNINEVESTSYAKLQNKNNNPNINLSSTNNGTVQDEDDDLPDETNSTTSDEKSSESSHEASDTESSGSENDGQDIKLSLNNNDTVQVEDDDLSDESNFTTSDEKSSESSDEASDTDSSESEDDDETDKDQPSSDISKEIISVNDCTSKVAQVITPKTKRESKVKDNPQKQKHSNEKRLDALQEKKKSVLAQRNVIKDALKDLDSGTQSHDGKKHIVFSDDDDDDEEGESGNTATEKAAYSIGDKISGSKASSWLGLDSDSEEEHDQAGDHSDGENEQLVIVKPHFEGKAGEELFKLQRTFGGDKRFELDSRFLESEEEDDDHHLDISGDPGKEAAKSGNDSKETDSTQNEDDISRSLAEEKEMAMKVLSNILGGNFRVEYRGQDKQEKIADFSGSTVVHYDPDREDHKQFEQTASEKAENPKTEKLAKEKQTEEPVLPEVSQDKYHHVNTDSLADLFGSKNQGASFTFFSQHREDDADSTAEEHGHLAAVEEIKTNPWQAASKLPYDSSGDDDDDMDTEDAVGNTTQSSTSTSHLNELFFFHPNDPELANRINDKETPFMRTGSQEDVNEYWVSVRSDLTQDYKRKRKDAVRRQNKLAAKRTRHR